MSVYDLVGNLTGSTDRRGKTSTFEFDKLNRNYRATTPGSAAGSTVNSYTLYDKVGNTIKTIANTTETINPVGEVTHSTFDMANRVRTRTVEVRQPVPNPTKLLTTTFDYDGAGNQTWSRTRWARSPPERSTGPASRSR